MKTINNFITEKLQITRNKRASYSIFNPDKIYDQSYLDSINLTHNIEVEFHTIYNSLYEAMGVTDSWLETRERFALTLIVDDETYKGVSTYIIGEDEDWGFGILDNNGKIAENLKGILETFDYYMVTTYDQWYTKRKNACGRCGKIDKFKTVAEKIKSQLQKD